jgi:hypothetical protein
MKNVKSLTIMLAALILLGAISCYRVTDAIVGGAVSGLGRAAGERAEQAVYKKMAPKEKLPAPKTPMWGTFMALQAQIIFSYSFSAGGLWLGQADYQPGDWTKFEIVQKDDETKVELERAYLKKDENGNQWWRVSWSDGEDAWVYEALLAPESGSLLRLRAKDVDGNIGEVPVSGEAIYIPPTEPTEESIKGATKGTDTITTPAGTYKANHVVYLATTGEGQVEWWLTKEVPGGVVKYLLSDKTEGVVWTSTLKAKGTTATTVLESF